MTITINSILKQTRANTIKTAIDAGSGAGLIRFYADPRPASGAAPTGALLGTITLTDPCGTVDSAGLHLTAASVTQAVADGVITWARVLDSTSTYVFDADVRDPGAYDAAIADFLINSQQVYAGGYLVLASALLAEGG